LRFGAKTQLNGLLEGQPLLGRKREGVTGAKAQGIPRLKQQLVSLHIKNNRCRRIQLNRQTL
jgi:hypothetical protein